MTQRGDAPPRVEVWKRLTSPHRHRTGTGTGTGTGTDEYYRQIVGLSMTDALELRAALGWVLEVADAG